MKNIHQFFFDKQSKLEEHSKLLKKEGNRVKDKILLLNFSDFCNLCETCLPYSEAAVYTEYLTLYTELDLKTNLTKTIRETKEVYLEIHKEVLTDLLSRYNTESCIVWFYFKTKPKKEL